MAKLKGVITEEDHGKLEAGMRELYEKRADGSYELSVEGVEEHASVRGLRAAMERQKADAEKARKLEAELKAKYGDLDADKAREAIKRLQEMEDKKLIDAGKIEEVVQARVERMKADHSTQITGFQSQMAERDKALAELKAKYLRTTVDSAVTGAVARLSKELAILPSAQADILRRARDVFSIGDDGSFTATGADGLTWYGSDPSKPISVEEWLQTLRKDSPHYFAASGSGGGATGGKKGSGGAAGKKRSELSAAEKVAYIKEHGEEEYLKLPA